MNRKKLWVGGLVIAVSLVFGMVSFKKTLTPYVSFAEARSSNRTVQVKGYPDHRNARFDPEHKAFLFAMKDDQGDDLNVIFRGPRPGNFDQAESVVAIGRYTGAALESDQILVKCPSKYESEYPGAVSSPDGVPMDVMPGLDDLPAGTESEETSPGSTEVGEDES